VDIEVKHAASVLKLVADVIRVWKLPEPEPQAEAEAAPNDEGLGGTTRSGWLRQLDEDEIKKNGCQFCPPW
jgi:hypothetical protein